MLYLYLAIPTIAIPGSKTDVTIPVLTQIMLKFETFWTCCTNAEHIGHFEVDVYVFQAFVGINIMPITYKMYFTI